LATPNYSYEKRQRELAKKRKNEEKLLKKKQPGAAGETPDHNPHPGNAQADGAPIEPGPASTAP